MCQMDNCPPINVGAMIVQIVDMEKSSFTGHGHAITILFSNAKLTISLAPVTKHKQ